MPHQTRILFTEFVTHDVRRFITTKPDGFDFEPGQGVELAIEDSELREEDRPFTPTSLPDDPVLEFTIKRYAGGMTEKLHQRKPGDLLTVSDAFGTIRYKGPGVFIAAGAGVTPFLAIIRQVRQKGNLDAHEMIFSNKTPADVICEKELRETFGDRCLLTCTRESRAGFDDRRIDKKLLTPFAEKKDRQFYVCGPPKFVKDVKQALDALGVSTDSVVLEE